MKGNRLAGKTAIITGGATGIGEAVSKKFTSEGAQIVIVGFPDDPLNEVVEEIKSQGGQAIAFAGDISDEQTAIDAVESAISEFGKLDILVNCAGVYPTLAETHELDIAIFDLLVKNNVRSTFAMTKSALPYLQQSRGNVVATGSEAGFLGQARLTPYGGTKGFIHAFIRGVALEQAKYGVRANCVCPGPIDTAWTRKEDGPMDEKAEESFIQTVALGRRGTTEEVANVFLFLASDEASFVTGSLFSVDGGIIGGKGVGKEMPEALKKQPQGELSLAHEHDGNTDRRE
jgi:NAD(P)-dependent dehydrogenase (short-subunit alcohol dehydrogenase family)